MKHQIAIFPRLFITLLFTTAAHLLSAQHDIGTGRISGSSTEGVNINHNTYSNIQLTTTAWSGTHGILFNAYKSSSQVSGNLFTTGNAKYYYNEGSFASGAGAIGFYGNGGRMDFMISPTSTGANQNVVWSTPKMSILRDGSIGIDTTTPSHKLDVNGSVRVGDADGTGLLFSEFTSALTDVPGSTTGIQITGPVNTHVVIDIQGNNSTDGFYVRVPTVLTPNPTVDKTAFVVRSDGQVGIGTTDTHGYELAVAGGVLAEKVYLETQPNWPDYVFSSKYNLKSLEDTEAFIEANHHLPEIPSAQNIEKNGYDMGQMNAKLLQKIEELTLHLIDQNKQNQDQSSQLRTQNSLIKSLIEDNQTLRADVEKLKFAVKQ